MPDISQCPSCGGPTVDAGGLDVICLNCGSTFQDMVEAGESEEMVERLVELGIDPLDIDADDYFD